MANETKIKQCLKKFGFDKFRSDIQEKAILSIINGLYTFISLKKILHIVFFLSIGTGDVFISFPTGAGKYVLIFLEFEKFF